MGRGFALHCSPAGLEAPRSPAMPKQITDILEFLQKTREPDVKMVKILHLTKLNQVKFKFCCSRCAEA